MIDRILFDGLYLGALKDEIAMLKKSPGAARKALAGRIRETLKARKRWPADPVGRAALVLWLMEKNNAELLQHVRLRHPHEKIDERREANDAKIRESRAAL